jgi:7-keto-8-aminopelargonate synthetase-like enzyme
MSHDPVPLLQSPPGPSAVIDGRRYLYFVGTGYLGLQGHPEVVRAACEAARQFGVGSATTRAGYGNSQPTLEVERLAAELLDAASAFYLPTGYAAASVLAGTLAERIDAVFLDELSHFSLAEAAPSLRKPVVRFRHADADDLRAKIAASLSPGQRPLVLSDGVFAARGRIAPVADYLDVLQPYTGAALLIDDAHGLGVLGPGGRGTFEQAGLHENINIDGGTKFLCGTLSKAIGGYGGILAGSPAMIDRTKAASHWYDGASPMPAPVAAATARGLELVLAEPGLRAALRENVRRLRGGLRQLGMAVEDTPVPIVCLVLGNAARMKRIQCELRNRGILVAYMAAYSGLGPEGALRLAVFANHGEEMIEQLLDALQEIA